MLLVDWRAGSCELLEPLRRMGLPAESGDIPADIAFEGRGEQGTTVLVGIEYKKLPELVTSLRSERLQGHQLPKMRENFEYCYLLIEGELHYDEKGRLSRRAGPHHFKPLEGGMSVDELLKRLFVLHLRGGFQVLWGRTRPDSLRFIAALYHTWTDCALDQHGSHIAIYQPPQLIPISEFRAFVTRFEGIGLKTSKAIETHFRGSLRAAVNATKAEWMKVPGIGPKLAQHIVNVCEGRSA